LFEVRTHEGSADPYHVDGWRRTWGRRRCDDPRYEGKPAADRPDLKQRAQGRASHLIAVLARAATVLISCRLLFQCGGCLGRRRPESHVQRAAQVRQMRFAMVVVQTARHGSCLLTIQMLLSDSHPKGTPDVACSAPTQRMLIPPLPESL